VPFGDERWRKRYIGKLVEVISNPELVYRVEDLEIPEPYVFKVRLRCGSQVKSVLLNEVRLVRGQ